MPDTPSFLASPLAGVPFQFRMLCTTVLVIFANWVLITKLSLIYNRLQVRLKPPCISASKR